MPCEYCGSFLGHCGLLLCLSSAGALKYAVNCGVYTIAFLAARVSIQSWDGVNVTSTPSPRVTKLEIHQRQLQADFANVLAVLKDLPSLHDLRLPANGLTGVFARPFPGFLGGALVSLDLSDNMLSLGGNATAISEWPQQLPNLQQLIIARNALNVSG